MRLTTLTLLALIGLVLLCGVPDRSSALRWHVQDGVIRAIEVAAGPPISQHTLDVRAAQLDINEQELDAIQFYFSTNWAPRFVLRFFSANQQEIDYLSGRWLLWKIVEYVESASGSDGFEPGVDTQVSEKVLWVDAYWEPMALNVTEFGNGGRVYSVCTSYVPPDFTPLEVELCSYLANRLAVDVLPGQDLSPNALKWSLNIKNYPFVANNSRLALKVSFDSNYGTRDLSESEVEDHANPTEQAATQLGADGNGGVLDVAWTREVDVTGGSCGSTAQVIRGELRQGQFTADLDDLPANDPETLDAWTHTVRVSYFSFLTPAGCKPTSILWDPEMGGSADDGAGSTLAPSVMVMVLVVAMLMFLLN